MNEKQFGNQIAMLRKEANLTQDDLAEKLHVSSQAVSKWENGHSLPETALLPSLSRLLGVGIDELFNPANLVILEAYFGDGIEAVNVTKRLSRLIDDDKLDIKAAALLLSASSPEQRAAYLTVKYKSKSGVCYRAVHENEDLLLTAEDKAAQLPESGLLFLTGSYGTKAHHYDVMSKMRHYQPFQWDSYTANHETFPSVPANDDTEYLTLVYLNGEGIKIATCAEGERLAYSGDRTELIRQYMGDSCYIATVPELPPFGSGMECSWAAALTSALKAMRIDTSYEEVMGVSGACYRIAFCSPDWDYSSVDGLVAYDYATPGYAAYGYTPEMHCHVEKSDRAEHRSRIMKEIRKNMPVLGINLRVAPEWGVICGYDKEGEELYCRTKYDRPTIENDPQFMKGHPEFKKEWLGPNDYMQVDNWPFLLCYFQNKLSLPTRREKLISSLKTFLDCAEKTKENGYYMGFKAYEIWAADLRDQSFYDTCGDERMVRRFSVNQFCILSLLDARRAAQMYLSNCAGLIDDELSRITDCFARIAQKVEAVHQMLDSGMELDGSEAGLFWNDEKREAQAKALDEIAEIEKTAYEIARLIIDRHV